MNLFNSILFLLILLTNGIRQEKNFGLDERTTFFNSVGKTYQDTLSLYFPLKDVKKDFASNELSLDTATNIWYSQILTALKEPILTDYNENLEVYRFTWIRTFNEPLSIRIEKQKDKIILTTKVLSGLGGYNPGHLRKVKKITITEREWNQTKLKINRANFWTLPVKNNWIGTDGAVWILEGSVENKYHWASRWMPGKDGDFGRSCLYLLKLSGINILDKDIY